jgi:proton glutamate symport protein
MTLKQILLDPKTVLAAVVAGFLIGLFASPIGAAVFPIGSLYIAFLSMCLLPILITAIINGIAGLLRDVNTRPIFKNMALLYALGLIIPCVIGMGSALVLQPGSNLSPVAEESIGALITASPPEAKADGGVLGFLLQVIPTNVFEALSSNDVMAIVFLSVCIGLAIGTIHTREADQALGLVRAIYDVFMQLYRWGIIILAPGLLLFISGVVARSTSKPCWR